MSTGLLTVGFRSLTGTLPPTSNSNAQTSHPHHTIHSMTEQDLAYRIEQLEHATRNGYSPLALKIRLDALETQVAALDKKQDERFERFGAQLWRAAGLIVTIMILATSIVSVILK